MSIWFWVCHYVDMSDKMAFMMSIPSGNLIKIHSRVMRFVFVGSEVSHSCRAIVGS